MPTKTDMAPKSREEFSRDLVIALTRTLASSVGPADMSGTLSVIADEMGGRFDAEARDAQGKRRLSRDETIAAIIALKRRIGGSFHVTSDDGDTIALKNTACPFGPKVAGQPALCTLTSGVFGRIVADNLGYGRVRIAESIAKGHGRCKVTISLTPPAEGDAALPADETEYFADTDDAVPAA